MKRFRSLLVFLLLFFFWQPLNAEEVRHTEDLRTVDARLNDRPESDASIRAFEAYIRKTYESCLLEQFGLKYQAFRMAMTGYELIEDTLTNAGILTVADLSQPSTNKRLYVIDIKGKKLLYRSYVAHGKRTGGNRARFFGNVPESHMSSLGFYTTAETYWGKHGYSLRLDGIERGINHLARQRAIVMHKADYVSESFIQEHGRLGRSLGCPALSPEISQKVIDTIKGGSCLFVYHDNPYYQRLSDMIDFADAAFQFYADLHSSNVHTAF